jgi:hypothetical protein
MKTEFLTQVEFSLGAKSKLQDPEKVAAIEKRIQQIKEGDQLTIQDVIDASVCFDISFNALLRRAVLESSGANTKKAFADSLNRKALNEVVFIATNCIARLNQKFYYIHFSGKIDDSLPVDEALLQAARELFINNNLPVLARQLTTEKSFYAIDKLPENEQAVETYAEYMFFASLRDIDKVSVACFNRLKSEEDKKRLLQMVLDAYRNVVDADIDSTTPRMDEFLINADVGGNSCKVPVRLTDLYELLDTSNEEKKQLLDLMAALKEKLAQFKNRKREYKLTQELFNHFTSELGIIEKNAQSARKIIDDTEKNRRRIIEKVYHLMEEEKDLAQELKAAEEEYAELMNKRHEAKAILEQCTIVG